MKEKSKEENSDTPAVSAEDISEFKRKLNSRLRHIQNVQDIAILLADRLADCGEFDLARRLVQRALRHDSSKFEGVEWDWLDVKKSDKADQDKLQLAVHQHRQSNDHHPEFFSRGVHDMSEVEIAEMVCDWKARSDEFGSSLVDWIKEEACRRYGFTLRSKTYQKIKYYVDLMLDPKIG